jgi:D-alanyl-lipoteichoic acid acyltransferase DltB (MBOAT superfamily)
MLFPTIEFAFFFAVVFPLTWLLNDLNTAKKWFLVAASYFFYAAWRADFTLILLTSSVVNFCLALLLGRLADGRGRWRCCGSASPTRRAGAFIYNFFAASTMNPRRSWANPDPVPEVTCRRDSFSPSTRCPTSSTPPS